MESIGGTLSNASARSSTSKLLTPANAENVLHMSQMWISSWEIVPRKGSGMNPPLANAATRTPAPSEEHHIGQVSPTGMH